MIATHRQILQARPARLRHSRGLFNLVASQYIGLKT